MSSLERRCVVFLFSLVLCCACAELDAALAQEQETSPSPPPARRDDSNHDVHLYTIIGSNDAAQKGGLPQFMDGVSKQLKSSLPFENYRLASTHIYRVKDGGGVEVRGVSMTPLTLAPTGTTNSATFFQFKLDRVRAEKNQAGQSFVEVRGFRFSQRVPVVTGSVRNTSSSGGGDASSSPVIHYEDTGISTDLNVRDGEPALVSTITTSRPDDALFLVLLIRRAAPR